MICPFNARAMSAKTLEPTRLFSQRHQPICGCVRVPEVVGDAPSVNSGSCGMHKHVTGDLRRPLTTRTFNGQHAWKSNFSETSDIPSVAPNKPSWAVTCAVKRSVCSIVVEKLMITTGNNVLTRARPECSNRLSPSALIKLQHPRLLRHN